MFASLAAASAGELAAHDFPSLRMALHSAAGSGAVNSNAGLPANYQPVESAWYIPGPNALVDTYTAAPNTTGTLVVDGAHVLAAIDTPGDEDWFKVTLTAGETYEFGQYARAGGVPGTEGNGAPLADAYLELYDANGNLLSYSDGGGPNTPNGLDALLSFEATYTGTYYVNATSFDQSGDGVGDFIGDYEIFARVATGLSYSSEYDISSPLHSIDWGGVRVNREHVAVENPDGAEGPRPTGDPAADPATVAGNFLGFPGKNVIYLYFGGEGDIYAHPDTTIPAQVVIQDPYQYEVQAMLNAASEFSKVADVVFVSNYTFNSTTGLWERDESIEYKPGPLGPEAGKKYAAGVDGDGFDADFFYFSYPGTPGPGISLLGSMNPPDYADEGVAQFNSADQTWNAQMLQRGGYSFITLIHEFGHGMGLAHPHDTGGGSSVMPGVNALVPGDDGGKGTHGLNQQVFTMMSYNDGWEESPYGRAETTNEGYGWLGSLMALDIAVIQDKYGVNEDWATGNDTYVLKDTNQWGVYVDAATGQPAEHGPDDATTTRDGYYVGQSTFYSSIWDAGGTDEIKYVGTKDTTIDLRPATLKYETGGGGFMSYAFGIHGGFTIANGVTIENASSGSGNDKLTGNAANNRLEGNGGNDNLYLWFGGGNDTALGGSGHDNFFFGGTLDSNDIVTGGADVDTLVLQGAYSALTLTANVTEIEGISLLGGGNTNFGEPGTNRYDYVITTHDANFAAGLQVKVNGSALLEGEDFTFNGSAETDAKFVVYGGRGKDTFTGSQNNDIFFFAEGRFATGDTVNGGAGYDGMFLRGNYTIDFNAPGYTGLFTQIENLTLSSATDERYARGGGTEFDYNITLSDALIGAGAVLTVNGGMLMANETMIVDGSLELDGLLRLFGGKSNDTLKGGSQNDSIFGNFGADNLTGGGGADIFLYHNGGESTAASRDHILDFAAGTDRIDLTKVDANTNAAGDQAFAWIGSNAFSGSAGQLRAYQDGANWFVEGDTNGDSVADLVIQLTVTGGPLTQSDFLP